MPQKERQDSTSKDESTRTPPTPPTLTTDREPSGFNTSAAAQATADAVRQAEMEQLRRERDELKMKLGNVDADELTMLRAETDALRQVAARAGAMGAPGFVSAGVQNDLETLGYAVDPSTGATLVLDRDTRQVTATTRTGHVSTFKLDPPPPPSTEVPASK